MYFCTPVVVPLYKDFVDAFGAEISFGCYDNEFSAEILAACIRLVKGNVSYEKTCIAAAGR